MSKARKAGAVLQHGDRAVAEKVAPYRQSRAVRAIGQFAKLGDQPPLRVLCGAVIVVGLFGGDRRLTRAGARMLAAHTLATWTKDFIKRRVDRTRPRTAVDQKRDHRLSPGRSTAKEETSFPSGHSAGAAALACAFAREFPEYRAAAYGAASALALAQIPRCAHYPTDIGAGLAIGAAAEKLVDLGFERAAAASILDPP